MANPATDHNSWRLATAGGIRYKLMHGFPKFTITAENATSQEEIIVRAEDMGAFFSEALPAPQQLLNFIRHPPKRRLPGTRFLIVKQITAEPLVSDLPADPFGSDSGAASGTYGEYMKLSLSYETNKKEDEDEEDERDPETFLTHSVTLGGEYLNISSEKMSKEIGGALPAEAPGAVPELLDANGNPINVDLLDANGNPIPPVDPDDPEIPGGDPEVMKSQSVPMSKVIPTIEHILDWKEVPNPPWGVIRRCMGKVNDDKMPIFFNASQETVMFMGLSGKQEWTWDGRKPWTLSMRFSERAFTEQQKDAFGLDVTIIVTWNHFWVPGDNAFRRVWRDPGTDTIPIHQLEDFSALFKADSRNRTGEDNPWPG